MLPRWLLVGFVCRAHGAGVSAPKQPDETSQIPWQDCPWLLNHLDLRSLKTPLWCYDLADAGRDECERAYMSPSQSGSVNYRRCVYHDGKCNADDGTSCRLHALASLTEPEPSVPVSGQQMGSTTRRSPAPPPPPPPPPPPRPSAVGPSAAPPPEVPDPFAPSMRLQLPRLISADCQSMTVAWSAPQAALAGGVPPRYALYYGTGDASSERPWNMGLRGTSTTVTGLRPGETYSFSVAMQQTRGWGPRSSPLVATTAASCVAPADQADCSGLDLGAPLVSALNCVSLVVELPPIPQAGGCSATGREVVVQMRLPGESWGDVRRDVQSSTVIVGDLDPFQASEFRIVLRRAGHADWIGQVSPRVLTEDGNSTVSDAPRVRAVWRPEGPSYFVVSWERSRGRCRGQSRYELQAASGAEAALDAAQQTWTTVADNVEEASSEASCRSLECCTAPSGCIFRVRPLDVRGWSRPGSASAAVFPASTPASGGGGLLSAVLRVVLLLLLAALATAATTVARVVLKQYRASRALGLNSVHVDPVELQEELTKQARIVSSVLLGAVVHVRENVTWLSRAWLGAVGLSTVGFGDSPYRRPPEQGDEDDEDDRVELDDFAPITAVVKSGRCASDKSIAELGSFRTGQVEGDLSDAPTVVMRL